MRDESYAETDLAQIRADAWTLLPVVQEQIGFLAERLGTGQSIIRIQLAEIYKAGFRDGRETR